MHISDALLKGRLLTFLQYKQIEEVNYSDSASQGNRVLGVVLLTTYVAGETN
ncbi:MAG: hypothetical protein RL374_1355 [Actinomycetota bacterium]|jgi:hypothetical protein